MATVKINNKAYEVPELNFRHSKIMERMGLPLSGISSSKYALTAVSAFVAVVVGCEEEQADYLVEQHMLGGGNIESIYQAYAKAIEDSVFFKKLLQEDEQEKKTVKKSQVKTE